MYIPGFTNMLMQPENFGGPARATLPLGVQPSAPPIMQAPMGVQPSAPPIMAAPTAVAAQLPGSFPGQQSEAQSDFQLSDEMLRNALRTMPGAARPDFNAVYTKPSLNPSLDYRTLGDQQGYYFTTNAGRAAKTKASPSGFVALNPEAQYRLVNERGKNQVVASGTGEGGLQSAYQTAQQLSAEQGKKADWKLEVFDPAVGKWVVQADDDPKKGLGVVGDILGVALPVGAAILTAGASIPVQMAAGAAAGGLGAAAAGRDPLKGAIMSGLTAGAGAAGGKLGAAGKLGSIGAKTGTVIGSGLGATAGGLTTGQSLGDALKGGALAAAGTFGGQQLGSGLRDLGVSIPGVNVPKGFTPGNITVTAPSGGVPVSVSTGSGGGGQPKPPAAETNPETGVVGNGIVVRPGAMPIFGSGLPALIPETIGGSIEGPDSAKQQIEQKRAEQEQEGRITVTGERMPVETTISPQDALAVLGGSAAGNVFNTPGENIIIAEQARPDKFDFSNEPAVIPPIAQIPTTAGGTVGGEQLPQTPEEKSFLDKLKENLGVTDYLRLAALGVGLLSGGGGGRGALGTIPGGLFGGGSGVFSGGLPAPTLPGATGNFAPRTAADLRPQTTQDWYRYGYGPEQSFFSYVPEGEENKSQAYTGYYEGGDVSGPTGGLGMTSDSYAVNGPGTGRSDEIPALLSDGEYVIDAETVALLGDGSSKAGAERLDQLRVNIRKDKGRKLAKGEFSVDAKRPEHYLKGGRV